MVTVGAIEGIVDDVLAYHYDVVNDVLYLRLDRHRETPTHAEETADGFLLLRRQDNNEVVGMTVVNWWKRFGKGALPDSLREIQRHIEPWAKKLAA